MWKCPNCQTEHSCGCRKQTAINGTRGCSACVPKINAKGLTASSSVATAIYKGPGKQVPVTPA